MSPTGVNPFLLLFRLEHIRRDGGSAGALADLHHHLPDPHARLLCRQGFIHALLCRLWKCQKTLGTALFLLKKRDLLCTFFTSIPISDETANFWPGNSSEFRQIVIYSSITVKIFVTDSLLYCLAGKEYDLFNLRKSDLFAKVSTKNVLLSTIVYNLM